jgi:biopolymer transport protein ExbD
VARGRFKKEEEHMGGELNLVPYLDIMINIIMFMLLTYQVVAELRLIQYNPPASAPDTVLGNQTDPDKPKVMLTIMVMKGGFDLVTTDENYGTKSIPLTAKSDWDYSGLTQALVEVRGSVGAAIDEHLIVVAESDIIYDTVVKTLDAARATADGKNLFPNVTLAMATE